MTLDSTIRRPLYSAASTLALTPILALSLALAFIAAPSAEAAPERLQLMDVFQLEYASDPRISPNGRWVVYTRNSMDVRKDRRSSNLWIVPSGEPDADHRSAGHRPLTSGGGSSPRWSPGSERLAYVSGADGSSQIYVRWMDSGQTARLAQLPRGPQSLTWSPDGKWLAFVMLVPDAPKPFVELPSPPEGAEWADKPRVVRRLQYRADGAGFLEHGHAQVFVLPDDGGSPRQLTSGPFHHRGGLAWDADGKSLIVSANRHEGWEHEPNNSEIYRISLSGGSPVALTSRKGPDNSPVVSPDGRHIAYLGFEDRYQGYQLTRLSVMNADGRGARVLTRDFDRSVSQPRWAPDGESVYFLYHDKGRSKIDRITLEGEIETVAEDVGGTSLGRPYSGGSYSVSKSSAPKEDRIAFTLSRPNRPADVAVTGSAGTGSAGTAGSGSQILTGLNEDLLAHRELGEVEELWTKSSYDGRPVQSWLVKPPGFEAGKKYPLILEIHGGPFANYGPRFAAEVQLFAAAGYAVLYSNPRGSTSYGEEFGNLIHHNYPGQDYDDLMSAVDAAITQGWVDPQQLFVTGGSGGGVLTSWIVGKTDRFRAAVVAKPVIHWTSFVLTADAAPFFYRYWFPGFPWDHQEHYWKRSPLSLVGNVTTPTMLLTGEADYRTPMSETEQYYQALKLRKVDSVLVRIPDASHGIAARPSQLIAKVAHILKWFDIYREKGPEGSAAP